LDVALRRSGHVLDVPGIDLQDADVSQFGFLRRTSIQLVEGVPLDAETKCPPSSSYASWPPADIVPPVIGSEIGASSTAKT
jgi:hypothetical protein